VLLIRWNLSDDTFDFGQWFKGRVYERRCDLSPEGDLLLYFAANYRKPHFSWSAVSRPPYFTALALWPKGDGWGGGGHFTSRTQILLNHRSHEMALAQGFSLPEGLSITQFGDRPGWGEDDPVWWDRLKREAWELTACPEPTENPFNSKVWIEFDPPITWEKAHPLLPDKYRLRMSILGFKERDGPSYLVEHMVIGGDESIGSIGRSEWADWSQTGDLLFSRSGCLFRLEHQGGIFGPIEASKQIADFSALEFQEKRAPNDMRDWPSRSG
jgi:hypothetical protein